MIRTIFLPLLFMSWTATLRAQQTAEKFIEETHYYLYLPGQYHQDSQAKFPLLIFLHGSGESGDSLAKVKTHGPPKLIAQGRQFPFLVVSPQAPLQRGWQSETLNSMLEELKTKYRIDPDRVYLTGLSRGDLAPGNGQKNTRNSLPRSPRYAEAGMPVKPGRCDTFPPGVFMEPRMMLFLLPPRKP